MLSSLVYNFFLRRYLFVGLADYLVVSGSIPNTGFKSSKATVNRQTVCLHLFPCITASQLAQQCIRAQIKLSFE